MTQPSFDPSKFLGTIGPFNDETLTVDPSDFAYSVDPAYRLTTGLPFDASVSGTSEYDGLFAEWSTRTQFNGAPIPVGQPNNFSTFATQFDRLVLHWSSTNVNPNDRLVFPRTWGDFITQFRTFFGIPQQAATGTSTAISNTNLNSGPAWDGFLARFKDVLKTDTDWLGSLSPSTVDAEFVDAFSGFLGSYPFSKQNVISTGSGIASGDLQNTKKFLNNWRHFITVTAVVDPNTTSIPEAPFTNLQGYTGLLSYKEAYKAFFPNSTDADFTAAIQAFQIEVNADQKNGGYFVPSQQYERFFDTIKNKLLVLNATQGTIMANGTPRLEILWQIFATILDMIQVIQKTTAISAQRLGFLTNYQKAYTELIAQIPTFLNGQPFTADETGPINSKLQAFAENLRSFRGIITDDSKSLQSSVNGLNESGNQQANLATDLLQQMSSLLSTIMK